MHHAPDPSGRSASRPGGLRGFLKSFATVALGSLGGQAAVALSSPVLSRIYGPEDYGVSGVVIALTMVVGVVATLRYDAVILIARSRQGRANAVALVATLLTAASALLLIGLACAMLWRWSAGDAVGEGVLRPILLFAPLIVLVTGIETSIVQNTLLVSRAFRRVATAHFAAGLATASTQIGLGLLGFAAFGIVLGKLCGHLAGLGVLLAGGGLSAVRSLLPLMRRRRMARVARAHYRQAAYQTPALSLSIVAGQAPLFLLAPLFGAEVAGAYYFSNALAMAALSFFNTNAPAMVLREATRQRQAGGRMLPFVVRLTALIGLPAVAAAAILAFYSVPIMVTVFGDDWRLAGEIVAYTGFFYAVYPLYLASASVSQLLRSQYVNMLAQFLRVVGAVAAMLYGASAGDHMLAIKLLVASNVTVALGAMAVIMLKIAADDRRRGAVSRRPPL